MRFKCPVCAQDFGQDKEKWKKHIETAHYGAGKDILSLIVKAAQEKRKPNNSLQPIAAANRLKEDAG